MEYQALRECPASCIGRDLARIVIGARDGVAEIGEAGARH